MLCAIHDLGQREVAEFKGDRVPPSWPGQAQRAARPGRRPPELELTSVGLESVGPAGAACPRRTFADLAPTSVGPLRVVGRTSPRRSDLSASVGPFVGRTFRDLRDVLSRTWRQRRSDLSTSVGPFGLGANVGRTSRDLSRTWRQRRSDLSVGPIGPINVGRTFRRSDLSSVGPFGPFVPTSIGAAWSDLLSLLGVGRI